MKPTLKLLPILILAGLTLGACEGTPTSADPRTDNSCQIFAELDNSAGDETILGARSEVDGRITTKATSASGIDAALLFHTGDIVSGNHTVAFVLTAQTTTEPTSYTVPAFDITIFACGEGALSDNGLFSEVIHMPAQTAALVAGQAIVYRFWTPDCVIP
jgi:hypothetical protein